MFFKFYRLLLHKYPFRTEAVQTGLLMGAGDLIAQKYVERKRLTNIDFKRTQRFFFIGAFVVGPPLRLWYGTLHKFFGSENKRAALKKVIVDQIIFAPVFMAAILTVINYAQTHSVEETKEKLMRDYPDVLKNNYKVWPAVQLLNFHLVPLKFQVAVVQVVALFWNTYISWKTNLVKGANESDVTNKSDDAKKPDDKDN